MKNLLKIFEKLKSIMTVSGYETVNAPIVRSIALDLGEGFFDSSFVSPGGSVILVHKSKKEGARTLLVDAHLDTIGLAVSELLTGGFVRCANIGGIDRRILTTAEVEIYGKRTVRGLFSSIPPHLANKNGDGTLPDFADFLVDTGLPDDELKAAVSVGDVVVGAAVVSAASPPPAQAVMASISRTISRASAFFMVVLLVYLLVTFPAVSGINGFIVYHLPAKVKLYLAKKSFSSTRQKRCHDAPLPRGCPSPDLCTVTEFFYFRFLRLAKSMPT